MSVLSVLYCTVFDCQSKQRISLQQFRNIFKTCQRNGNEKLPCNNILLRKNFCKIFYRCSFLQTDVVSRRESCLKWSSSWSRCLYELCPVDHTSPFQKGRLKVNCQLNMKTSKLLKSQLYIQLHYSDFHNVSGVSFSPPQRASRLWASEDSSLPIIPSECFWGILLIMLQMST